MKNKIIIRDIRILLAIFILFSMILAPNLIAQDDSEENSEPKPIPTADILKEIETTSTTLHKMTSSLNPEEIILSIEDQFPDFLKIIEEFQKDPDMELLENLSASKLKDLRNKWISYLSTVKDWEDNLVSRSENLENDRITLLEAKRTWEVTDTAAKKENVPNQMLVSIDELMNMINEVQSKYQKRLNEIISLQNNVSDKVNLINTNISAIDVILIEKQSDIFTIDSKPLLEAFQTEEEPDISEYISEIFKRHSETLAEFYVDYKYNIIIHLTIFIVLLAFLLSLRRFGNKLIMDKDAAEISQEILNHPYSVAILVVLLLNQQIYPQAPSLISKLAQIMSLIPVLRLLPVLYARSIHQMLLTFIAIYFLNLVYVLSSEQVLIHRIILLLISTLSFGFLVWILRKKWLETIESDNRLAKFGTFITILFSIFIVISIISNIIGNVSLASLLTTASLRSIYLVFIFLAGSLVVIGLLNLILSTKFAHYSRIVRVHPQIIRKKIRKSIYFISSLFWIYFTLRDFTVLEIVYDWIDTIISARLQIGSVDFSFGDVLVFFLAIYISIIISRFIRFLLDEDILVRMQLPRGVSAAISMMTNYAVIGLGFLIAFSAAGFELSKFAIMLGALGVGIGFGLQNIVNNFISGLIIIFERPIQMGDTIAQGELLGTVTRIGIRSSTIRTFDGAEVIVPNANLVSNEVTNWTLSDRRRRIQILVGVAYGTDPNKVLDILRETIKNRKDILDTPEPMILFREFGESSLNFDLRFWTSDASTWLELQSTVNVEINNAFKKAGIEIPFPQRDLHLRSVNKGVIGDVIKKQQAPKKKPPETD